MSSNPNEIQPTDVFLDFETHYDDAYSLKKMSTEEYVRDPRFEVHMLAAAVGNGPVRVYWPDEIEAALREMRVGSPDVRVFIQNAKFDAFITTEAYGIVIANPICTRCMERWTGMSRLCKESLAAQAEFLGTGQKGDFIHESKGLHLADLTPEARQAYADYCALDVELLRSNVAKMLPRVSQHALDFISLSVKMYTDPRFELDKEGLVAYAARLETERTATLEQLLEPCGIASVDELLTAIRSPKLFPELLAKVGGEVPMKWSDKQKKQVPALAKSDPSFVALTESPNPAVAALASARLGVNTSIETSRCARLQAIAERGTLPVSLEAFSAHTGRYTAGSSEGIKTDATNLQNLSKRASDMTLRHCILAPQGYKLVACDSSQIEARVLAWLAGETWLINAFANKEDPYCKMAASIYREPYETILDWTKGTSAHAPDADPAVKKKYKTKRNVGKTAVLQLGYYAGAERFATYLQQQGLMLADTEAAHLREANRVVNVYRSANRHIKDYWGRCDRVIRLLAMGRSGTFRRGDQPFFECHGDFDIFGHKAPTILLPDDFPLVYANLRRDRMGFVYDVVDKGRTVTKPIHAGILCNNLTQAVAFAIIRWQACEINKRYPIRINIHDSLGVLAPDAEVEECRAYMEECMRRLPDWAEGLPIDCESEVGEDFSVA